jgi:hypothetical protein
MVLDGKARLYRVLLIAIIILAAVPTSACRNQRRPATETLSELDGEPEQYSATMVHTIYNGATRETSLTREARSGDKSRQEWTEGNRNWALIWRPDLERGYLLDLDQRVYVEIKIGAVRLGEFKSRAANSVASPTAKRSYDSIDADSGVRVIDRYFDDTPSPARTEVRLLSPVVIDGYECSVYEQRAIFADGHAEITRRFRAVDLGGLIVRIEGESAGTPARTITERRDVRLEVAPDAFVVPTDFKRIESVP